MYKFTEDEKQYFLLNNFKCFNEVENYNVRNNIDKKYFIKVFKIINDLINEKQIKKEIVLAHFIPEYESYGADGYSEIFRISFFVDIDKDNLEIYYDAVDKVCQLDEKEYNFKKMFNFSFRISKYDINEVEFIKKRYNLKV